MRTGWVPRALSEFSNDPGRIPFKGGPGLSESEKFQPALNQRWGGPITGPRAKGNIQPNSCALKTLQLPEIKNIH